MARPREPVELVMSKGKKHLTKAEIKERMDSEVKPCADCIEPPSFLSAKQKKKFREIADQLQKIGIMGETDVDALARYVTAQELYEQAVKNLQTLQKQMPKGPDADPADMVAWAKMLDKLDKRQDRYFKQAHTAASSLGLTISGRCKLVMPKAAEEPKGNKFSKFGRVVNDDS